MAKLSKEKAEELKKRSIHVKLRRGYVYNFGRDRKDLRDEFHTGPAEFEVNLKSAVENYHKFAEGDEILKAAGLPAPEPAQVRAQRRLEHQSALREDARSTERKAIADAIVAAFAEMGFSGAKPKRA